nr:T9SS type A sorting domain-containing protein [Bacteroidota bacterium]
MNWVEISQDFTIKKVVCFEINPTNPHCFYAGTQQYAINGILYRSLDSGVNWTEILDVSIMDLKVDPNNDQKLIAAADYDRIYYSEDNGDTWDYYHGFPASTDFLDIAINANNSEEMLVASQGSNYAIPGIYRSTNGGLSWFGSGNGMASRLVFSVLIDYENGQNAFCGSTVGFHKSVDGGANWVTSIAGMKRLFVYSILVKPNNPDHWIAKTDLGVAITENQGRDWVSNFGYCMPIVYLPGSDTVYGILGSGSFSDGVYRSIDDGFNWVVVKYMMYATDLDIVNENPSTMYVITSGSVYRSDNGGYNWTSASGGINENPVKCLEIDQNHPDTMFAITTSKVWKTVDGGIAWDELLGPFEEYEPVTLNVDPINSAQIYIGTNEAMIKSENGGDDWIVEDLPCTGLRAVSVSSVYDGFIAAGFDTEGVYISQDEGSTWTEMNEGLNNKTVNCMAISPGSEFLLCGTHGDAIYKSDISFVGLELEGNDILSTLNIFPVPAKDEIYIETDYEFESIEVYNISGERQKISYDRAVLLSGLPPGIYFVAVHFANGYKSVTRKIVKM